MTDEDEVYEIPIKCSTMKAVHRWSLRLLFIVMFAVMGLALGFIARMATDSRNVIVMVAFSIGLAIAMFAAARLALALCDVELKCQQ